MRLRTEERGGCAARAQTAAGLAGVPVLSLPLLPLLPAPSGMADPAQIREAWSASDKGKGAKVCWGFCAAPGPGGGLRQVSQRGQAQISIPGPIAPLMVPRCGRQRPA